MNPRLLVVLLEELAFIGTSTTEVVPTEPSPACWVPGKLRVVTEYEASLGVVTRYEPAGLQPVTEYAGAIRKPCG